MVEHSKQTVEKHNNHQHDMASFKNVAHYFGCRVNFTEKVN